MEYISVIGFAVFVALAIGFVVGTKVGRMIGQGARDNVVPTGWHARKYQLTSDPVSNNQVIEIVQAEWRTIDKRLRHLQRSQIVLEQALKESSVELRNGIDKARLSYYKK